MLEVEHNDLGDAISSMGKYCHTTEEFLHLAAEVVEEINAGSIAIAVFGSRAEEDEEEDSDTDVLSVNPNTKNSKNTKGLPKHEFLGQPQRLNKGGYRPSIDLIRVTPESLYCQSKTGSIGILQSAVFVWSDPMFDLNKIYEIIEEARDFQLSYLIDQIDQTPVENKISENNPPKNKFLSTLYKIITLMA